MTSDLEIINMKLESLRDEIFEYKIYLEVCTITLFFVFVAFLGTPRGINQIKNGSALGYLILITALILVVAIFILLVKILLISKKDLKEILKDKTLILQDWLR